MLRKLTPNFLYEIIMKSRCYHLKLFYFSLSCFLVCGCGKKIQGGEQATQEVSRPTLSTKLIKLHAKLFKNGQAQDEQYTFESDSEVAIPEVIKVKAGNAGDQVARLYFNVDQLGEFRFYCNYIGGASTQSPTTPEDIENGKMYYFDTCFIDEGNNREINYYPGNEPTIYKNHSILFRVMSADPRFDTEAVSELEIDTH
jgi:hypothetical protein